MLAIISTRFEIHTPILSYLFIFYLRKNNLSYLFSIFEALPLVFMLTAAVNLI